ncbi:MAG: hypothetical protein EOM76_03130 [Sphingobacteriia bacterium]|jgi:hypothetical protein|nr:hypothetical protein [Paludibacteraceae bacterium]NCA79170.1 hypothetical protein [Sphingobacteriia bacterium]
MDKKTIWLIIGCSAIILLLAAALFFMFHKMKTTEKEMGEMVEQMTYEKEQLEEEYSEVALEMEGFSYKTDNDSLLKLVDKEQQRVQLLLEELKTVKATNARRIAELKKELASVRSVLVYYITQVDSLNTVNTQLKSENTAVRQKYEQVSQTVTELSKEREQMKETITKASLLEASGIVVETFTDRDRKTNKISRIARFKISFTLVKNITATIGMKTVFVRIITPDDYILTKNQSNVFRYEDKNIQYSCKKSVEYNGENTDVFLYWNVEEVLNAGTYRVDIFTDNQLIGTQQFKLEK